MPEPRSGQLLGRPRSAPSTRAYSSSIRGEQLGRGHERPRLRHRLELPTQVGQPRRSEYLPVGLERVRRPTPLPLLVPLDHPFDARPRLPSRGHRGRTHPPAATVGVGADRADLQRGPAPVRGPVRPAGHRSRPSAALVGLATPTSSTRPHLPLPTTGGAVDAFAVTAFEQRDYRYEKPPPSPCSRSRSAFAGFRFPPDVIVLAGRCCICCERARTGRLPP